MLALEAMPLIKGNQHFSIQLFCRESKRDSYIHKRHRRTPPIVIERESEGRKEKKKERKWLERESEFGTVAVA